MFSNCNVGSVVGGGIVAFGGWKCQGPGSVEAALHAWKIKRESSSDAEAFIGEPRTGRRHLLGLIMTYFHQR